MKEMKKWNIDLGEGIIIPSEKIAKVSCMCPESDEKDRETIIGYGNRPKMCSCKLLNEKGDIIAEFDVDEVIFKAFNPRL